MALNSFRYRGYYYDKETRLYYLQSRYYDPEIGRLINADDIKYAILQSLEPNGLNLYAYCLNNPVMYTDSTGQSTSVTATIFSFSWLLNAIPVVGQILFVIAVVVLVVAATYMVATNWDVITGALGNISFSKGLDPTRPWPGDNPAWPGDDPTVPPLPGAEWKGKPGSLPGSNEGQWYLPDGTRIHPNFGHKPPKPPHWGWYDELGRLIRDFFRPGGWGPGGPPTLA